jgi:hypothetical protein
MEFRTISPRPLTEVRRARVQRLAGFLLSWLNKPCGSPADYALVSSSDGCLSAAPPRQEAGTNAYAAGHKGRSVSLGLTASLGSTAFVYCSPPSDTNHLPMQCSSDQ